MIKKRYKLRRKPWGASATGRPILRGKINTLIAPEQYKAAKKDSGYFMRLIGLAVEYHKEG